MFVGNNTALTNSQDYCEEIAKSTLCACASCSVMTESVFSPQSYSRWLALHLEQCSEHQQTRVSFTLKKSTVWTPMF